MRLKFYGTFITAQIFAATLGIRSRAVTPEFIPMNTASIFITDRVDPDVDFLFSILDMLSSGLFIFTSCWIIASHFPIPWNLSDQANFLAPFGEILSGKVHQKGGAYPGKPPHDTSNWTHCYNGLVTLHAFKNFPSALPRAH